MGDRSDDGLADLRAGDAAAFDRVYRQHREAVFRFLLGLCRRRPLAEDLFQETWLRLARHARTLRPDTDARAWLFTVARNLYRSHARWVLADSAAVRGLAGWWYLPAPGCSPHDAAMAADAAARLSTAVAALTLPHREILLLVAVEGLAVEQAAAILALSPEAARQRLHRARAQLLSTLPKDERP